MWKSGPTLEDQICEIKFSIRIIKKLSEKSRKQEKIYIKKTRDSIDKNDMERAELFAQQSIRHKHMALRYLNTALRMEIVESMAQSAINTGHITKGVSNVINTVTKITNPEKMIGSINRFEEIFDDLSISVNMVDTALGNTAGIENSEASSLLTQLKEEQSTLTVKGLPTTTSETIFQKAVDEKNFLNLKIN
jgi:hypothetical protein